MAVTRRQRDDEGSEQYWFFSHPLVHVAVSFYAMIEVLCIILHMLSSSDTDPQLYSRRKSFFLVLIFHRIRLIINDRLV